MKKLLFILCLISLVSCERAYGPVKPVPSLSTGSANIIQRDSLKNKQIVSEDDRWEYIGHGLYVRDYHSWGTNYVIVSDKNGNCVHIACH